MTFILAAVAGIAALDLMAWRYGAESRPGFDGRPDDRRRNL
jgi:hypothetical protein